MTAISSSEAEAIAALKCELAAEVLRSSGKLRLQVMGWSMLPSILPSDTLMIERTTGKQISKGDIILFRRDGRLFVHRVVTPAYRSDDSHRDDLRRDDVQTSNLQRDDLQIITQGDGIAWPDPPVSESQVLGKISSIERNGRLIEPRKNLDFPQRAVSLLVRRSCSAARLVAGINGMRRRAEADESCRS
jgi:hypothetical protein